MENTLIPTLSEYLLLISEKFSKDIKSHEILMKIHDSLFEGTKIYLNMLLFVQITGYFVPLVVQMHFSDEKVVKGCNYSCLSVAIFFHILEVLEMKRQSFCDYWYDFYNVVYQVTLFVYYVYFYVRFTHPTRPMMPIEDQT